MLKWVKWISLNTTSGWTQSPKGVIRDLCSTSLLYHKGSTTLTYPTLPHPTHSNQPHHTLHYTTSLTPPFHPPLQPHYPQHTIPYPNHSTHTTSHPQPTTHPHHTSHPCPTQTTPTFSTCRLWTKCNGSIWQRSCREGSYQLLARVVHWVLVNCIGCLSLSRNTMSR